MLELFLSSPCRLLLVPLLTFNLPKVADDQAQIPNRRELSRPVLTHWSVAEDSVVPGLVKNTSWDKSYTVRCTQSPYILFRSNVNLGRTLGTLHTRLNATFICYAQTLPALNLPNNRASNGLGPMKHTESSAQTNTIPIQRMESIVHP